MPLTEQDLFTVIVLAASVLGIVWVVEVFADGTRFGRYLVVLGVAVMTCSVLGIVIVRLRGHAVP